MARHALAREDQPRKIRGLSFRVPLDCASRWADVHNLRLEGRRMAAAIGRRMVSGKRTSRRIRSCSFRKLSGVDSGDQGSPLRQVAAVAITVKRGQGGKNYSRLDGEAVAHRRSAKPHAGLRDGPLVRCRYASL